MDIFEMSLNASILIVAIVLIRALALNRFPKRTFLALWGVAVLRLLVPLSVPSRFSFYTGLDRLSGLIEGKMADSVAAQMDGSPYLSSAVESAVVGTPAAHGSSLDIVWLVGMCACAMFFITAYIKCRREFGMSLPVEHDTTTRWLKGHPIHRRIQIRQSDRIKASLTYGVCRPVILFPKKTDWTDERTIHYILTHEFMHIRYFDALTKVLLTITVCVHWFNPFVWVMYVLANRDIELSCDESVVREIGAGMKSAYALMLIDLEEGKGRFLPLVNHFSKNAIEERIVSIMKIRKVSFVGMVLAVMLIAGTTIAFATSALAPDSKNNPSALNTEGAFSSDGEGALVTGQAHAEGLVEGRNFADDLSYWEDVASDLSFWEIDEFEAWMEEELRKNQTLADNADMSLYYKNADGDYECRAWTQEDVDTLYAQWEEQLEKMKLGYRYTKDIEVPGGGIMGGVFSPGALDDHSKPSKSPAVIIQNDGSRVQLGSFDTVEDAKAAEKTYLDQQVEAGLITQEAADEYLSKTE